MTMELETIVTELSPNSAALPFHALENGLFFEARIGFYADDQETFITQERSFGKDYSSAVNNVAKLYQAMKYEGNEESFMMGE